jgi:hypothetical protein
MLIAGKQLEYSLRDFASKSGGIVPQQLHRPNPSDDDNYYLDSTVFFDASVCIKSASSTSSTERK